MATFPQNPPQAPQNVLEHLSERGYNYSSYIHPLDLGSPGSGLNHYVVFHINETTKTQYSVRSPNSVAPKDLPTINANVLADKAQGINTTVQQPITRVATTIVLAIPPSLVTNFTAMWTGEDLGTAQGIFKSGAKGEGRSVGEMFKSLGVTGLNNASKVVDDFTGLDIGKDYQFQARVAINNHREVLFEGIDFRTFTFTFRFVPQSEADATNVSNICKAFRFYAAPEILSGTAGRFWLYPSEFDITFISDGIENKFINKISTCALTEVSVNYTPVGHWSAFRSGPSGSPPVCTELTLNFTELELITKQRVLGGF